MRYRLLGPFLVALAVIPVALVAFARGTSVSQTKQSDNLSKLLEERITVTTKIHEKLAKVYNGSLEGGFSVPQYIVAKTALVQAKLDVCKSNLERRKTYEQMLKLTDREMDPEWMRLEGRTDLGTMDRLRMENFRLEMAIGVERNKSD